MRPTLILFVSLLWLGGCAGDGQPDERSGEVAAAAERAGTAGAATALGDGVERLSVADLEAGRLDAGWRTYAERHAASGRASGDTASRSGGDAGGAPPADGAAAADTTERWQDISATTLAGSPDLPLSGDRAGPSVAMVQIALDRALFSPGIIDGRWGKNTEKAVFWLQERYGLDGAGTVDGATWQRLRELAGQGDLVREHTLTGEDVAGPFMDLPEDIYAQAGLECMCFESQSEKLAERFHTSPDLLAQLNPDRPLPQLRAGDVLVVPAIRDRDVAPRGEVSRIVISDGGHYVHAVDGQGRILYHFPSTLGSEYAPSPGGTYEIESIAPDPTWHYQPELLTGVPDHRDDAIIPPGPNNPVGVVWMQLSKPHYGIHGTAEPASIGYATSHGCVRLTNWDAAFLQRQVAAGTTVEFVE